MGNRKNRSLGGIIKTIMTVAVLSACPGALLYPGASAAGENPLPRKWEKFELGKTMKEMKDDLILFRCSEPTSKAVRCMLMGFPERDDFVVLKFYDGVLASAAQFTYKADWERTLAGIKDELGDPAFPAYRSSRALAYIWRDSRTYVTLTHLIRQNYVIYEIRDMGTELLYRKSQAGKSPD